MRMFDFLKLRRHALGYREFHSRGDAHYANDPRNKHQCGDDLYGFDHVETAKISDVDNSAPKSL